jgi:hypothetical protein
VVRLRRGGPQRHFRLALDFFAPDLLARDGFADFVAPVEADLAFVPDLELFLAPIDLEALFFAPPDFVAPLEADFAALFVPFLAVFLAPVLEPFDALFEPILRAPPDFEDFFEPDREVDFEADLEPEVFEPVVLLLAFAGGEEVLESPMAIPAASFTLVMAD